MCSALEGSLWRRPGDVRYGPAALQFLTVSPDNIASYHDLNHFKVELDSSVLHELLPHVRRCKGRSIGSIRQHRVDCIAYLYDSSRNGDLGTGYPVGVALSIYPLMMMTYSQNNIITEGGYAP